MRERNPTGKAMTVLGPVDLADLGIAMAREHFFIDLGLVRVPPRNAA